MRSSVIASSRRPLVCSACARYAWAIARDGRSPTKRRKWTMALCSLNLKPAFRIFIQGWMLFFLVGMYHGQTVKPSNSAPVIPIANFTDVAEKAGLTMQNIFGGIETKKYIIETTGTGVAIFD